jgi:beta-glucosidase-like glycosyl hydrolase|eukprot:COSAG01_NODE_607_length_14866_cov_60.568633_15_plen_57_part_00
MHWIRGMQFGIPGSPTYDPSTLKVAATAKHFSNYGNLDCLHVWLHVAQRIHNNKPP